MKPAVQGDEPDDDQSSRLQDEIALLQAMYPEQLIWNNLVRELSFRCHHAKDAKTKHNAGLLILRLPEDYLANNGKLPMVLQAQASDKQDVRQQMVQRYQFAALEQGMEVLDQMLIDFEQFLMERVPPVVETDASTGINGTNLQPKVTESKTTKTVVIWLHHLLALGKRKLALTPTLTSHGTTSGPQISGVTKPGYPGIMIFTGSSELVDSHVAELKNQRWQAFQVRFEETYQDKTPWQFQHGLGIKEVESMSEVVSAIYGTYNQGLFLQAAGVK